MKILVTGATGLVGINLVRRLTEEGHQVRILVRTTSKTWPFEDLTLEKVTGDITDVESVHAAVDGCEAVFHAAGYVNLSPFVRHHTDRINIGGTQNIIDACQQAKVRRLVHTSSIAAIGHGNLDKPATENSEWNFAKLRNPYTNSKRIGEQHVLEAAHSGALDAVVVNPAYIIGPWDIRPTSGRLILMMAQGKISFYPTGGISIAPVDAVVEAHIQALKTGTCGERYILGGDNLSYRQIMELMAEITGVRPPKIPLHPRLTWPLGLAGDLLGKFWPRTFADLNSNVLRLSATHHYVSSDKARKLLGYNPKPAREAIQEAYDWFKEHKYL